MLQVYPDTKIFIYCPAGLVTGGAELLHQLCDVLNRSGCLSYIVYYGSREKKIPMDYQKYKINISEYTEDCANNIIVICESIANYTFKFKKAQIFLWWLSVDNFYYGQQSFLKIKEYFRWNKAFVSVVLKKKLKGFLKLENRFINNYDINMLIEVGCHGYQSEYAKDFLINHGVKKMMPLKDYINTEYFNKVSFRDREDVVLYNPRKGIKFTNKLIAFAPEINWKPIENMTRTEVLSTMQRAKLYIDFGYHPGKDRLPREAAINGCCIITGKLGAAGFWGDIPIDTQYKFNQGDVDIPLIIDKIKYLLKNYNKKISDFESYRNIILLEKSDFEKDVISTFKRI